MIRILTSSVDQTKALARALAELVRPGDLIVLSGDLGAGKTSCTQGFAVGLGVQERVISPTFILARSYQGRLELNHLDVYRISDLEATRDLALPELLDSGGVTLIEWGDTIYPMLPADLLEVRLSFGEADDDRTVEIRCVGPRWSGRQKSVQSAMALACGQEPGAPSAEGGA
jgi:tRNA threonylcarbamoyladenosine biosynthesis protein TsaE